MGGLSVLGHYHVGIARQIAHRGRPPVLVRAQQSMPVGGYLSGRPPADPLLAEFRRGLAEIGFVERSGLEYSFTLRPRL